VKERRLPPVVPSGQITSHDLALMTIMAPATSATTPKIG